MKKTLLVAVMLLFTFSVFSQDQCRKEENASITVLTKSQVGDFTVTDSDGITWNLYDLLDQGRTVFLDLFYVD